MRRAALILVASLIAASCSEKSVSDRGKDALETPREVVRESEVETHGDEQQPTDDELAEDCVAFVRATRIVPGGTPNAPNADCPTCPAAGAPVLSFRQMKTDAISCSGETCKVLVTIRAAFNPGSGERVAGGLTAWIPPEQRSAYLSGQTPADEQTYRVQITYKRRADGWRAVEFDRAPEE